MEQNILKDFLEENSSEVMNMLITEWNWDDAREVWREEGREEGIVTTAKNALTKGFSIDDIHEITGLDIKAIKNLAAELQAGADLM